MRHQLTATFIATALLGLCACGGGDNNTPPLTVFQIAAYDAPTGRGNGSTLVLSLLDNAGGNTTLYNLKN
jgi:hypothetical protein